MSRRRGNNVRGPTSALTEFLRESGINPATIARRVATREQGQGQGQGQGQSQTAVQNGVQNSNGAEPQGENEGENRNEEEETTTTPRAAASTNRRPRRRATAEVDYASDQLDETDDEPSPKKRKGANGKASAKAKSKAKKKAKEDGDYQGSSEDEYTALSRNLRSTGSGNGNGKPPVGSFETCSQCEKQFTVTKYTMAANPPPGYLCHKCAKASGPDPFKKPAARAKKTRAPEKRGLVKFEEHRLPTLASLCIELIGNHIDDVEALGDIGSVNMDEIAKTLARNRSLTCENAPLFYDVQNKRLRFYDATNLADTALTTLASLNPNLTHLHLDYCGRITCPVMTTFSKSLPHLTHLGLHGPFLVRPEAWIEFFKSKPELRSFRIIQSARFDLECVKALANHCTKLEELQLKEVGQLNDSFVEPLCALPPLKSLDLSNPDVGVMEDGWIQLLERHGGTLESFDPSWHEGFTDSVLEYGMHKHARILSELRLEGLSSLTDEGVARFFQNWNTPFVPLDSADDSDSEMGMEVDDDKDSRGYATSTSAPSAPFTPNPPLRVISLARNRALSSATFSALLAHSVPSLMSLNLNGLGGPISAESLERLKHAVDLRSLDVSWCREVDDFVMKDLVANATKLAEVKVWGCTRIRGTGWTGKRGLKVYGIEPNAERFVEA